MITKKLFLILYNRGIKVNLFKLYFLSFYFLLNDIGKFSIHLLFHSPNQILKKKLKYFLSSHLFIFLNKQILRFDGFGERERERERERDDL